MAALAAFYDLTVEAAPPWARYAANGLIAVGLLVGASIVATRGLAVNEPFGESAAWIEHTFPECRGQQLLAIAALENNPQGDEPALWGVIFTPASCAGSQAPRWNT